MDQRTRVPASVELGARSYLVHKPAGRSSGNPRVPTESFRQGEGGLCTRWDAELHCTLTGIPGPSLSLLNVGTHLLVVIIQESLGAYSFQALNVSKYPRTTLRRGCMTAYCPSVSREK